MDQVPSFPTHQTPASSLSPSQHAAASHTQARLPVWLETIVQPPKNAQSQVNAQTPLFTPLDEIFDSSIEDSLHFNPYSQVPTWLADEHFDLNALNSSVMASTLGFFSPDYTANEDSTDITIQLLGEPHSERKEDQVRQLWFTYVGTHKSGYITPEATQEQVELDEQYRQTLSQRLQQRVPTEPLPSTDFLVSTQLHALNPYLCLDRLNRIVESVHSAIFHTIQSNLSNCTCTYISTFGKKFSSTAVYMLNRESFRRLQLCCDSGIYHFRETQQSHPSLGMSKCLVYSYCGLDPLTVTSGRNIS